MIIRVSAHFMQCDGTTTLNVSPLYKGSHWATYGDVVVVFSYWEGRYRCTSVVQPGEKYYEQYKAFAESANAPDNDLPRNAKFDPA